MIQLTPSEARVLGVLIEKAQTTPGQYPITLNALVNGCNQLSNRDPVMSLNDDAVFTALEGLRARNLAREVAMTGSRVPKYKHNAREALQLDLNQMVVLAELLLRGAQTTGELRGRASRMHPLETLDVVQHVAQSLMDRPEPLLRALPPEPGSRAGRFTQLLAPESSPISTPAPAPTERAPAADDLMARVERLERELAELREMIQAIVEHQHGGATA